MLKITRRQLREAIISILWEDIRQVKGGYKVYSKKGKPMSKKPKTKEKAQQHLAAIEMGKAMREAGDEDEVK